MEEFAAALRGKMREDLNNMADALAQGACRSFEDYKHLTGKIEGVAMAERHLLDLLEAARKGD